MLKKRLNPIYLLFLMIPIVYFLLWHLKTFESSSNSKQNDYLYFSVKASNPSVLSLIAKEDTLAIWDLNSTGYKNLQFAGQINDSAGLRIAINNLDKNGTISFLGFNLYRNNKVFSQYDYTVENAAFIYEGDTLSAEVQHSEKPIVINLKPSSVWNSIEKNNHNFLMTVIIFIIVFLLILVFSPPARYFIFSLVISILVMVFTYLSDISSIGRLNILSSSPMNSVEIYYNNTPFFTPFKKYIDEGLTNSYSIPINFETDGFLRCDVGDSLAELKDFQIKFKLGIFHSTLNLTTIPQEKLVLNDMVLHGNSYHITGNDPYIMLTSSYFIKKIKWLIFLSQNIFLYIALIVFLLIISVHRFLGKANTVFISIKFRTTYFAFLLIPITYFIITHFSEKELPRISSDQIYFSAHTSKPSVVILYNGTDSITSWTLNSPSYKYLEYSRSISFNENLYFKITELSEKDTISLLSINLYHNNYVYSLFDKKHPACTIKNTSLDLKSEGINAIVQKSNEPVIVNLMPLNLLQKKHPENGILIIIILIILVAFVFILIAAPSSGYFLSSCIISSLMMFVFFWICNDWDCHIILSTSSPVKNTQLFYNNNPTFLPEQRSDANRKGGLLKSELNLYVNNYLRCDIADTTKELNKLYIYAKTGLLTKSWDYSTIPSENLMMNDIIKKGSTYFVLGNDPYFVLTSASQVYSIRWMTLLRQNVFFIFSMLFFIILLFAVKRVKNHNHTTFFLVIIFIVLISFGFLLRLFDSDNIILNSELRYASTCPESFQLDSAEVLIKKYDDYLKDQVPGRSNIIIMHNLIEYSIFGQLVNDPNVHFGKDGWLFYIGGLCRENYENRHPLTNEELLKMKDVLIARRDWLRDRNIQFYFFFPPMACFVYEEEVGPRMWRYNKKSKVEQLQEYLKANTDLNIIDMLTPLLEAKKTSKHDLYFRNNSHWNYHGSFIAYRTLINYIKKDFPDMPGPMAKEKIKWVEFDNYITDLYKVTALDRFYISKEYQPSRADILKDVETLYPNYPGFSSAALPFNMVNKNVSSPSALLYGDSYSGFLFYYLSQNFSKGTYLWTPLFYPDIIEKEMPDMVIQEMNDYSIYHLLYPNPTLPEKKDTIQEQAQ